LVARCSRDFARLLRIGRGSAREYEAEATLLTEVGLAEREFARVLREHLEKLKASIANLEKRVSLSP